MNSLSFWDRKGYVYTRFRFITVLVENYWN